VVRVEVRTMSLSQCGMMKASKSERERSKPRTAAASDRLSMPGSSDRGPCIGDSQHEGAITKED
jgi:hypothetical protein